MTWWLLPAAVLGGLVGLVARRVAGRLPRGAVVGPGPVEGLGAGLGAGSVALAGGNPWFVLALLLAVLTVLLAPIDVAAHRLPDAITLPALPVVLIAVVLTTVLADLPAMTIVRGVSSAVAIGASCWAVSRPGWLGRGDAKLAPSLAMATGAVSTTHLLWWVLAAVLAAGLWSLGGLLLGKLTRTSAVPLGPFLLLAAWLVVSLSG